MVGILLPSLPRKTRNTSHQQQIDRQNARKQKTVCNLAHACATSLIAKARANADKENCPWTTTQVIAKVEANFRARGFKVVLSKLTINRYIHEDMIGTKPLSWGYKGLLPRHTYDLLFLAEESFLQINQVKSMVIEPNQIVRLINDCCGVEGSKLKSNLFEQVGKATNVLLCMSVTPVVEERRVRWTTYANLDAWFTNFRAFLVKFEFAHEGMNGELIFDDATMHCIINIDETEICLDRSKTRASGMHQNYGPFKSVVQEDLKEIAVACYAKGKTTLLGISSFGLIVYGGVFPILNHVCQNAVNKAFNVSSNKNLWRAVRAVPFTKVCLSDPKIQHDGTDNNNPNFDSYCNIQMQNDYAPNQLLVMGYCGDFFEGDFFGGTNLGASGQNCSGDSRTVL